MVEKPEQNGAAERKNRTIVKAARAMVHQKELPKTAAYVLNHTGPTTVEDKLSMNCGMEMATRLDIVTVFFASRALCKPTKDYWKHVKRIYRYLRGTSNVGLLYKSHFQTEFSVFSDADHAGDEKTRSSTSGMVSINSYVTITWWSRLQHSVAISSTEAEYVATREALMSLLGSVALQRVD
ncbi:hypothetical protein AVEN_240551-1 [Araneus ventricosus]|uniref:Retrovirus-related Pol polyprotein from transposon TNT 1-94 n=1 Tax=Araneus ventricosus TaxID=182803 RepID=A0A4Y2UBH4_ARAVE|nr:hypothetical protein AVEN_240551-1 [Araneus ventricosus]